MPFLSVLLVRTALCWLAVGSAMGALLLSGKAAPLPAGVFRLFHAHAEAVLVGWMIQFAMGVAWWILPKYPRLPERGPTAPVWAAWLLVNAGVVLAGRGAKSRRAGGRRDGGTSGRAVRCVRLCGRGLAARQGVREVAGPS